MADGRTTVTATGGYIEAELVQKLIEAWSADPGFNATTLLYGLQRNARDHIPFNTEVCPITVKVEIDRPTALPSSGQVWVSSIGERYLVIARHYSKDKLLLAPLNNNNVAKETAATWVSAEDMQDTMRYVGVYNEEGA